MNSAPWYRSLVQIIAMTRYEWRLGIRSISWRLLVAAFFLYGCSIGHVAGSGAGGAAYAMGEAGWRLVSFVAIIWMAMLGARETLLRTKTIVLVKPQLSEKMVLAWFVGGIMQVTAFLLALVVGSVLARIVGGSSPTMLTVYFMQFIRVLAVVFFVSAASFTLALLSDKTTAGMLVCLYLVLMMAGSSFLAKMFNPSPIQNNAAYAALGATMLCLAFKLYGGKRRGSAPISPWISSAGIAAFGLTVWLFFMIGVTGHDSHIHEDSALNAMQTQDSNVGLRAAGFLLPDQDGKLTGISKYGNDLLVITLFSPLDPDTEQLLLRLNDIQDKYQSAGVQVVAVCLSEDNSAARAFAVGDNLHFRVVTDWGTTLVPEKLTMSPIASAYRTSILPMVALTDRRRRVVDILRGTACYDGSSLNESIRQDLSRNQ